MSELKHPSRQRKHSVVLTYDRCRGCTTCIKSCPTEAIRVRRGKAAILNDRCIDCGKCIQACPHSAMGSIPDRLSALAEFEYTVALPHPALYGQFQNLDDLDILLHGLLALGFQKVYEIARACELLSDYARQSINRGESHPTPQISSDCPTVQRLIRMRFPKLIDNIAHTALPMELAAALARKEAEEETGLPPEKIGIFAIVPCAALVTEAHSDRARHLGLSGALSIREIYRHLLGPMKELKDQGDLSPLSSAGIMGVGWACCGGESAARLGQKYVAVDGIENVIRMLEEIEDGRLPDADFIELTACVEGCVGGCLTVENPFGAHMRIKKLMKGLPVSRNRVADLDLDGDILRAAAPRDYIPALVLDSDRAAAFEKMERIERFEAQLPGLHCGSCGAPSCHAFAEDVILGRASEEDCIFKMRERVQYLSGMGDADDYLPAPFRQARKREDTAPTDL